MLLLPHIYFFGVKVKTLLKFGFTVYGTVRESVHGLSVRRSVSDRGVAGSNPVCGLSHRIAQVLFGSV